MSKQTLIHMEDVTISYHEKPVLWDVDLSIPEGSRTAIIGPNGAGKSTLLKGILDLIQPISGEITLWGKSFHEVRKRIAYVPQTGSVNWDFPTTVLDVVTMGQYVHLGWFRRPKKSHRQKAMEALAEMGMNDFAHRQISQLSGGQKQRVFLARAICQDADLYFMDEPLAGVDGKTEKVIMNKIKAFQQEGKTIVAVHHDLHTLPEYFDHVVLLNRVLVADGDISSTFTKENIVKTYGEGILYA